MQYKSMFYSIFFSNLEVNIKSVVIKFEDENIAWNRAQGRPYQIPTWNVFPVSQQAVDNYSSSVNLLSAVGLLYGDII